MPDTEPQETTNGKLWNWLGQHFFKNRVTFYKAVQIAELSLGTNPATGPADLILAIPYAKVIYSRNATNTGNNALIYLNYISQLAGGIAYGYNSVTLGDTNTPAIVPGDDKTCDLGDPLLRWKCIKGNIGISSAPGMRLYYQTDWYNDPADPPAAGLNEDGLQFYLDQSYPIYIIEPFASGSADRAGAVGSCGGTLYDLALKAPVVHLIGGLDLNAEILVGRVGSQEAISWGPIPVPVDSSSVANPSIITCTRPHGLANGWSVDITGHTGSAPDINGTHVITYIDPYTFSIAVNVTTGGAGGQLARTTVWAGYPMILRSGAGLQFRLADNSDYADAEVRNATLSGTLNLGSVGEHADNAAAVAAGHVVGDVYRTGDVLKVVHA